MVESKGGRTRTKMVETRAVGECDLDLDDTADCEQISVARLE